MKQSLPSGPGNAKSEHIPSRIDIIIPVYNAYDYLKECLKSVLIHTPPKHHLIITDDCSTDRRVPMYIEALVRRFPKRITSTRNRQNLGFVKNVNKAMSNSKRDVILLNTDTIVTKGWVSKMITAAYAREDIATVTPFSNNGNSICSVPMIGRVNLLPEGYTVDSFAELISEASICQYPEIPTAVGFCMYIKRSSLDRYGLFDDTSFGKGYGEETDFSRRVINGGEQNVLADNTYIFHKGGASFDFSAIPVDERKKNGLKILKKRYPSFIPDWNKFIKTNPLQQIYRRIFFWMLCRKWRVPKALVPVAYSVYRMVR